MKKLFRKAAMTLLLLAPLFLSVSCQDVSVTTPENIDNIKTWGDFFEFFWAKMNTNYIFWNLEEAKGINWDSVYDQYHGKFESYGTIGANTSNDDKAYRDLITITKNLSDGHYALSMNLTLPGDTAARTHYVSPFTYRFIKTLRDKDGNLYFQGSEAELEEAVYKYLNTGTTGNTDLDTAITNAKKENADNIAYYIFGHDFVSEHMETITGADAILTTVLKPGFDQVTAPSGWSTLYQLVARKSTGDARLVSSYLFGTLAKSDKGVVYFGFSGFAFSVADNTTKDSAGKSSLDYANEAVAMFKEMALDPSTTGIIIDLRGNGGGAAPDLDKLWGFIGNGENIHLGYTSRKAGDNPMSYTTDIPLTVIDRNPDGRKFFKNIPIVVLLNGSSLSCSEVTALYFKALGQYYGYKTILMGEPGMGGYGLLLDNISEQVYNAGIVIAPATSTTPFRMMYTPFTQTKYRDGTCYEGVGDPVETVVNFDYSAFSSAGQGKGTDRKLNEAIKWIESNQ